MFYKLPTKRRSGKPKFDALPKAQSEVEEPGIIVDSMGTAIQADSKEEWWVYKGLRRIGIPFQYQYPINGGNTRGGYKVDFVVMTVPLATMIEPIGNHWHTGELGADDRKRQADVENHMQSFCKIPLENLWIPDLLDEETTYQRLLNILR